MPHSGSEDERALLWSIARTQRQLDLKCRDTVERMIKAGQLTSIKIGKRRMVVAQSVRDLIARQLAEQSTQKT